MKSAKTGTEIGKVATKSSDILLDIRITYCWTFVLHIAGHSYYILLDSLKCIVESEWRHTVWKQLESSGA